MQALFPGQKTLEELARWTPASITVWRFRRLLKASYWSIHVLMAWWAEEALHTLPPPKDGTLQLEGNGPRMVLDLDEVTLVDVEVVRFLGGCEAKGIILLHCSPYIREWIAREQHGTG